MTPEIEQLLTEWPMGYDLRLPASSTCVVAGMYKGRVAELLHELYKPKRIVGYDPQLWALNDTRVRAHRLGIAINPPYVPDWGSYWEINNFAIGVADIDNAPMGEWETDGCSFINYMSRNLGCGNIVEIGEQFERDMLYSIQCVVFNMEGYEYELLPHMVASHIIERIERIAVQFHVGLGNALPQQEVYDLMAPTHYIAVDDFPRWVLWKRKDIDDADD
jgi:hypothetical protein